MHEAICYCQILNVSKFNETFDGVLLAYDVHESENLAKILSGIHPYLGVRVKAQLLLFYPRPDMLLEGTVVKLGEQSIHVVILGFSSAAIIDDDIREEFRHKIKHGKELFASTSHKRHKIKVGTVIRFAVKSFDEEILHVSGSLLPSHTGSVLWLDKNVVDQSLNDSVKKQSESRSGLEMVDCEHVMLDEGILPTEIDRRIPKTKKRRTSDS